MSLGMSCVIHYALELHSLLEPSQAFIGYGNHMSEWKSSPSPRVDDLEQWDPSWFWNDEKWVKCRDKWINWLTRSTKLNNTSKSRMQQTELRREDWGPSRVWMGDVVVEPHLMLGNRVCMSMRACGTQSWSACCICGSSASLRLWQWAANTCLVPTRLD